MSKLTIIVTHPAELDRSYLDRYLRCMAKWNRNGLKDTQLILLMQRSTEVIQPQYVGINLSVIYPDYEMVNGYPIWDTMKTVRTLWPQIDGQYVTFDHTEFIWGPDRLENTINWLVKNRPVYAIGNLRRPGTFDEVADLKLSTDTVKRYSDWFTDTLDSGDDACEERAANIFEMMETAHWMYWDSRPQKPGAVSYIEDVFYADKRWLDTWRFAQYPGERPFQDVYDLMGIAFQSLMKLNVHPKCVRMPQLVNRILHLWHPRLWLTWTEEIRQWFASNPVRWAGTRFLDKVLWDDLIQSRINGWPKDHAPVNNFRRCPNGTVTSYGVAVSTFLQRGGADRLKKFYTESGV
jgi:hypothetical protein